jgi:hypothetical protein
MSGGGNDPFSNTNSRNVLKHLISPKVVSQLAGGYVVKTDLINVDNIYITGGIYGPSGPYSPGGGGNTGATGPTGTNGTNGTNGFTGATGPSGTNGVDGFTGATGPTGAVPVPTAFFYKSFTAGPGTNVQAAGGGTTSNYTSNISVTGGKWYLVSGTIALSPGVSFTTSTILIMAVFDNGVANNGNSFVLPSVSTTSTSSSGTYYVPISGILKTNTDATFLVISFACNVAEPAWANAGTICTLGNVETLLLS